MPADVAAERQLNVIERLLALMPRSRGFQVKADASISVYPASSRARLPAAKQKSYPRPPKRDSRSEQAGSKRAANARTRRSAARAAKHAQKSVRRRMTACGSWQARWPTCSAGGQARMCGPRSRATAHP